ncbi:helix-turn-helix domain-containing protein [Parathalassolituus penaei]|uniref:Helix-turn-helix domain-containing protein n=1 Tax=Parathalassolituus penaei TaxID=2997323 RepID=A0A9X3EFI0_9GAMM|nr:helix-turn-helix domain-containing protein [Parathalassolituus penaei]MCY0966300.1 helix-turn-helix domain-containing protein [Parathalassolituus penaei]
MRVAAQNSIQPQFRTWDWPEQDRRAFWLEQINQHVIRIDCPSPAPAAIEASLTHANLDQARLNLIRANPHSIQRSHVDISNDQRHSVFACFMLEGLGFTWQGNRCAQHGPGDIVLYDTQLPYGHGFSTDMAMVVMDLPEPVASQYLGNWKRGEVLHLRHDIRYSETSCVGIHQQVNQCLQQSVQGKAAIRPVLEQLQILLINYLSGESNNALWRRCEDFVQRHLAEDSLGADLLATNLHISERQLSRLFAQQGTSVQRYIWQQRLSRCREDICNPQLGDWSISDIAFHWGFNHSAHFSRRYRDVFGESPTETRQKSRRISS